MRAACGVLPVDAPACLVLVRALAWTLTRPLCKPGLSYCSHLSAMSGVRTAYMTPSICQCGQCGRRTAYTTPYICRIFN